VLQHAGLCGLQAFKHAGMCGLQALDTQYSTLAKFAQGGSPLAATNPAVESPPSRRHPLFWESTGTDDKKRWHPLRDFHPTPCDHYALRPCREHQRLKTTNPRNARVLSCWMPVTSPSRHSRKAYRQAARHRAVDRLDAAEQRINNKPAQCAGLLCAVIQRRVLPRSHPARRGAPYSGICWSV